MDALVEDRGELLSQLKIKHKQLSYTLSMTTIIMVTACAAVLWWRGYDYSGHEQILGLLLMLIAGYIHLVPYLSYRIIRFRYRDNKNTVAILAPGWKMFQKFPGG